MSEMNNQASHAPTSSPSGVIKLFLTMMGSRMMHGGAVAGGAIRLLSGYSSAYLLPIDANKQQYMLIDTGADPKATEILAVVRYLGLDATAVKAILLTHAHNDHAAGLRQFPEADVYVGAEDADVIRGLAASDGFLPGLSGKQPKLAIANEAKLHIVGDKETLKVGDQKVQAFAVPGHTRGSMAYAIGDVLYIGDALTFGKKGQALKPPAPLSYSVPEAMRSLAVLVKHLEEEHVTIETVVPSHSGEGSFGALKLLANKA